MTKHYKYIAKLESLDIRKILIYYTKIIYKNNKNRFKILEAMIIIKKKKTLNT